MTVYLVGAGPGDPELITVKGARLLATAEVVVHDRLVSDELLATAPVGCEMISAAKAPRQPTMPQEQINQLLVERGLQGQEVVRLKGGDPCIFARGGEEAAALAVAGVRFEIVPGISSAIAGPVYAGIPVTLRGVSLSVHIVTGHEDPSTGATVDWDALARVGGTLVVLMGAARSAAIAARLMSAGLSGGTPAATVHWATHDERQQVWRGRLDQLGVVATPSPSIIVIGHVAAEELDWFRAGAGHDFTETGTGNGDGSPR